MEMKIKIYSKKHTDAKTGRTYFFTKGIVLNSNETKVIYGDIKWFIKKEIVESLLGEKRGGLFVANIAKVTTKDYVNTNGTKTQQHTFEITDITPLSENDEFNLKISTILEKSNTDYMNEVFK